MTGAALDKAARVDISFTDNKNRGGARYRAALGLLMGVERTRQMMKIGFIGTGNMGGALASAAARSGEVEVLLANRTKAKAETLAERIGAVVSSNEIIAREADHIFLGVKPQMLPEVLDPIKDAIHPDKLVVTIAAGKGFSFYASYFGENVPLVRVMPNICAQVLCSASAVCPNAACRPEQVELVRAMFRSVGEVYDIPLY